MSRVEELTNKIEKVREHSDFLRSEDFVAVFVKDIAISLAMIAGALTEGKKEGDDT